MPLTVSPMSSIPHYSFSHSPELHFPSSAPSNLLLPEFSRDTCPILSSLKSIGTNVQPAERSLATAISRAAADIFSPIKNYLQTKAAAKSAEIFPVLTFRPLTFAAKSTLLALAYSRHHRMAHDTARIREVFLGLGAVNTIHSSFDSSNSAGTLFKFSLAGLLITLKFSGIIK